MMNGIVKRNRNCYRRVLKPLLHDPMTSSLPDCRESVLFENLANFPPDKTRSLSNRNLNLRDEHLAVITARKFGRIRGFKKQSERFNQIRARLLNS
jgi:hypothetical protein